ncbi:metal ABC transporter permease [Candidatus Bathyarchaeota archaeon]|nr:metal ABC transporter permease [Candidatus Bathyarchaeota archaeon]
MTEILILSIVIAASAGLASGYLGSLMVLEKMALIGDALSHVALPGLALGLIFNFNPFIGAFITLYLSAIVIWHLGRVTRLGFETLIGAVFTLALAVGILITPEPELLEALFGDISKVTHIDVLITVLISAVSIMLTRRIYRRIVLSLISEEIAISSGINVARTNLLFLLLVSTIVAIGIKITGTLLVGFLVIVPAAAARTISQNLSHYSLMSSVFGVFSASGGILLSDYLNLPPGPLVVLTGVSIFAAVIVLKAFRKQF